MMIQAQSEGDGDGVILYLDCSGGPHIYKMV